MRAGEVFHHGRVVDGQAGRVVVGGHAGRDGAGAVVLDRAQADAIGDGGIGRRRQVDGEGFAAFVDDVVPDVDGDGLAGLAGSEGQRIRHGGVVQTGRGGAIGAGIGDRHRHLGGVGERDREGGGARGFIDDDVVDRCSRRVVVRSDAGRDRAGAIVQDGADAGAVLRAVHARARGGHGGIGRVGQHDLEGFRTFIDGVVLQWHVDGLAQFARSEGQRAQHGVVVEARFGRAVDAAVLDGDRQVGRVGQRHREAGLRGGFVDLHVVDGDQRAVVVRRDAGRDGAGAVILDRAQTKRIAEDDVAAGVVQGDVEGLAAFIDGVVQDGNGDRLAGLARREGQGPGGGAVVETGFGGAVGGREAQGDRRGGRAGQGHGEGGRAGTFVDDHVVDGGARPVVGGRDAGRHGAGAVVHDGADAGVVGDEGVDARAGELDLEGLRTFIDQIVGDGDGDGPGQLARGEGQRAGDGVVVAATGGGVVDAGVADRDGGRGRAGQRHGESGGAGGFVDRLVVDAQRRQVVDGGGAGGAGIGGAVRRCRGRGLEREGLAAVVECIGDQRGAHQHAGLAGGEGGGGGVGPGGATVGGDLQIAGTGAAVVHAAALGGAIGQRQRDRGGQARGLVQCHVEDRKAGGLGQVQVGDGEFGGVLVDAIVEQSIVDDLGDHAGVGGVDGRA